MKRLYRRFALWLDRHGFSTWEHAKFEWERYPSLRNAGLTHRQAIRTLDEEWNRSS